jgi:hypothetical protein
MIRWPPEVWGQLSQSLHQGVLYPQSLPPRMALCASLPSFTVNVAVVVPRDNVTKGVASVAISLALTDQLSVRASRSGSLGSQPFKPTDAPAAEVGSTPS